MRRAGERTSSRRTHISSLKSLAHLAIVPRVYSGGVIYDQLIQCAVESEDRGPGSTPVTPKTSPDHILKLLTLEEGARSFCDENC